MTKEEALKRIEEITLGVEKSLEEIVKIKEEMNNEDDILVPKELGVTDRCIWFNDFKQNLRVFSETEPYRVSVNPMYDTSKIIHMGIQYKLIPVKREDLNAGDVAFHDFYVVNSDIANKENYCIIINEKEDVSTTTNNSILAGELDDEMEWYKVVKA